MEEPVYGTPVYGLFFFAVHNGVYQIRSLNMGCTVTVKGIECPAEVQELSRRFATEQDMDKQEELYHELSSLETHWENLVGPWDVSMSYSSWMILADAAGIELDPQDTEDCVWVVPLKPFIQGLRQGLDRLDDVGDHGRVHLGRKVLALLRKGAKLGEIEFCVC